jgi:uncharacterized protein YjdB
MPATTYHALKGKNDSLVFSALDWALFLHEWQPGAPYMPTDICDSSGVIQTLPAGWQTAGEVQKAAAVSLAPDLQTSPIEGYGSSAARRVVPTGESMTIDYIAQEWSKINLSIWHNVQMAAASAQPGKGFRVSKTSELNVFYYSALLIARDVNPSGDLYPFFMFPKVAASKRGAMNGQSGKELPLGNTLTIFEDHDFGAEGGVYDFGVAGSGFDLIADDAGFLSAPSSILVTPPTLALTAGQTARLTVTDDNGFDRTAEATYASSATSKATVDAAGRVTAVAAGTANITATLGALNGTCAVTVS